MRWSGEVGLSEVMSGGAVGAVARVVVDGCRSFLVQGDVFHFSLHFVLVVVVSCVAGGVCMGGGGGVCLSKWGCVRQCGRFFRTDVRKWRH